MKQLLRYQHENLVSRVVRLAEQTTRGRIVVVLGCERMRVRRALHRKRHRVEFADNARWDEGLASSLRKGVDATRTSASAALILVTDQVLINAKDLSRLVRAWRRRPGQAASACYAESPGVPAIFPRRLFPCLKRLQGDQGARQVLRNLNRLTTIDMPRAAFDVDTPDDAARLGSQSGGGESASV
jgi:molybdenum cofactor cytidylyltransferase